MEGFAMILLLANTAGSVFFGWALLYREPQYTGWSWFALVMTIVCGLNVMAGLINR